VLDLGIVHVLFLSAAALATAGIAVHAWHHRDRPGVLAFAVAMVGMTVWNLTDVLAMTQTGAGHLFWERVQWVAIAAVPPLLFLFMARFTGYGSHLPRRAVPLLFVVPAVSLVLVWTNPAHGLMWTDPETIATAGVVTLDQQFGPWFWVVVAFDYGLLLFGFLLLLRLVVLSDYLYFDQSVLIVVGILAPLVGNALGIFDLTPLPGLDLTTYGFTITGIAFGNAIFRYRMFDLLPATRQLGRQAALAALDEGVVIVGDEREILYLNAAAARIFDCEPREPFGESVETLLGTDELDFLTEDAFAELVIGDRVHEVTTAPITDQHDRLIGHTIVLHDVTTRKRREQTLREQRDDLARLERLNRVIRSVNRALVGVTTRDDIAREVCETLVSAGPYGAARFGVGPATDEEPVYVTDGESGTERCESVADPPDRLTVEAPAIRNRDAGEDDSGEAELAASDGAGRTVTTDRSEWTAVPLVHGRTVYGSLALRSGREDGFDERELDVLAELGEMIGHALHAVEQQQLLVADAGVELEFASTDSDALLVALSEAVGPCMLDGLVPGDGGTLLAYVTVEDATPGAVRRAIADGSGVSAVRPIDEDGSATVEVALSGGSLCCPLVEYGANVQSAEATDGACHLVAEVSPDADVRTVVEQVTSAYPDTELRAKRDLSSATGNESGLPAGALAELTDRQREVIEAAYRAGYFEWPRDSTAEEVADSLDIASSTLHSHLRKAEAGILSEVFEGEGHEACEDRER
jgi:predicted DNA binding protein